MFSRKNGLSVTERCFRLLNETQTAIEILSGKPVQFKHFSFSKDKTSGRGLITIDDDKDHEVEVAYPWAGNLTFRFDGNEYHTQRIADDTLWIRLDDRNVVGGYNFARRFVGTSGQYKLYSL